MKRNLNHFKELLLVQVDLIMQLNNRVFFISFYKFLALGPGPGAYSTPSEFGIPVEALPVYKNRR